MEEAEAVDSARTSFLELHIALKLELKPSKAWPERISSGGAKQLAAGGGWPDSTFRLRSVKQALFAELTFRAPTRPSTRTTCEPHRAGVGSGQLVFNVGRQNGGPVGPRVSHVLRPIWPRLCLAPTGTHSFYSCRLAGSPAMEVRASQAVTRRAALQFVDATLCPDGCRLGEMAWGPGWCFFFHLKVCKHSRRLIPGGAHH